MRIFLSLFLCAISVFNLAYAQTLGDYRSNVTTGNWHTPASWQVLTDVGTDTWATATQNPPTTAGTTITIRSGHSITIAASAGLVTLSNNLTINSGGTLTVNNSSNTAGNDLAFAASGVLTVNGTLVIGTTANTKVSLPPNGTTYVSGTLTNTGTLASLIPNGGTVEFSGTSLVNGNGAFNFFNVAVNPSTTLTVNSGTSVTVNGDLSNSGTYNSGNTLFLKGTLINDGTFSAGTTFTLDGAAIANDLINNGTFNAGLGSINFSSTAQGQNISGSAPLTTFNNININNGFGVNIESVVAIMGALTLSDGSILDADGAADTGVLTIRSTGVSSGGRIAELPETSDLSGNITVERFINGPDTWRYLSIPIVDGNVGMWKDDFPVTGNFSDPSPNGVDGVTHNTGNSIYFFNPATNQYVAVGSGGTTASTPLSNTVGYSVYSYKSGNFTISVRGQIAKGSIPVSISNANGGYNLVPNPYPSAIDWDNVDHTGMNDAIWIRIANNQYASFVGGVPVNAPFGGWDGEIAMGQSFWMQSAGATTLNFEENNKTGSQSQFLRESAPRDYMRITLLSATQRDETVIRFADGAAEGFDSRYDARKLKNGDYSSSLQRYTYANLSSYTTSASEDYAVNSVAPVECTPRNLNLKVDDVAQGNYKLMFTDLDKMDVGYTVTLIDKFLNSETAIEDGDEYSFAVTANALSKGASRFELKFTPQVVAIDLQRNFAPVSAQACDDPLVRIDISDSQPDIQYTFKLSDTSLHEPVTGNGGKISVWLNKQDLDFGLNKLSLVASSQYECSTHTFDDAVSVELDQVFEVVTAEATQQCGEGSVTLSATGAPADGSYKWYETSDGADPIAGATQAVFNTPALAASKTYFVSIINGSGCESAARVPVEAKIVQVPEPEIITSGHLLTVSEDAGVQWYQDDVLIAGATGSEYEVIETGTYKAVITHDGCVAESEGVSFIINGVEAQNTGIHFYPNPTSDYLNIPNVAGPVTVSLYDEHGRVVSEAPVHILKDGITIDMRLLQKGMYLIGLSRQNQFFGFKVLKQ